MTTLSQSDISIANLRAGLAGAVIGPEDAEYEHARRVFLSLVDRRPAVIVGPLDPTASHCRLARTRARYRAGSP